MQIRKGDGAVVTGASRGIGRLIARGLAERGVNLVVAARTTDELESSAEELRALDVEVVAVSSDMGDPQSVSDLAATAANRLPSVDILVNNAAIEHTERYDLRVAEGIRQMIAVNLTGPMLLARLLLPGMIERNRGHIVNVASLAGLIAAAYEEPYNASKYGLVGFTRSLRLTAQECGWSIGASAICPGFVSGTGIYERMKAEFGVEAPRRMGAVPAETVVRSVVGAIEHNLPDVVLMKGSPRLIAALAMLAPRLVERLMAMTDSAAVFRKVAERRVEAGPRAGDP